MRPTLVFRVRHVSHARDARGIRRCEARLVFTSGASIIAIKPLWSYVFGSSEITML